LPHVYNATVLAIFITYNKIQGPFVNARLAILLASFLILTACMSPPQMAVSLAPGALNTPGIRVGILMTPLPIVNTQFPGAGCLLCLAGAEIAHSSMTAHTKTLPYENLPKVKDELANRLRNKGATVTMIEPFDINGLPGYSSKEINMARKDFTALKAKHNIDKLVVIAVDMVGIERNFSSYIPNGDPKARVSGVSYMVNLSNNSLEWYLQFNVLKASDGLWDEPPKFPGLTNAYFQTLEMASDQILAPFAN
jgi:hypothetical protein